MITTINSKQLIDRINHETNMKINWTDNIKPKALITYDCRGLGFISREKYVKSFDEYELKSEDDFISFIKIVNKLSNN